MESKQIKPTENLSPSEDFTKLAEEKRYTLWSEFIDFLGENKKWWLVPILLALALAGLIVVLSTTSAAPFLYTLF